jgi:hypothetical protein
VTTVRLLLAEDLVPIANELCDLLGVPFSTVRPSTAWDAPVHRTVQIGLPQLHARVFDEAAGLRGASVESFLTGWIERCRAELAGDEDATVLRACGRLAEWERLGYTGAEPAARELAREIARP